MLLKTVSDRIKPFFFFVVVVFLLCFFFLLLIESINF